MFVKYNANPINRIAFDCTVRAISVVTGESWDKVFDGLCRTGYEMCEMPSANIVWGRYLKDQGYKRRMVAEDCPYCYNIKDFCADFPQGKYVVGTGTHAVAVINGNYIDTWDSGNETALFYWQKEV